MLPALIQPTLPAVEQPKQVITVEPVVLPSIIEPSKNLPFIEANTKEVEVSHLKNDCIIPVFSPHCRP